MSTAYQRLYVGSQKKKDNKRTQYLRQCPQARGWVNRTTIVTPRKPNSAKRPVVKVFLRKGGRLTAYIPGIGHTLKKFSKILVRGRGPRDLPAVRYSCVRGVQDFIGLEKKKRRRSIYGAPQNDPTKIKPISKYRWAIRRAERDRVKKENIEARIAASSSFASDINKHYISKSYDLRYQKILRKFQIFRRKFKETPLNTQLFLILIEHIFIYFNKKNKIYITKDKFTESQLEFYLYLDCGSPFDGLDLTHRSTYFNIFDYSASNYDVVGQVTISEGVYKSDNFFFDISSKTIIFSKLSLNIINVYNYFFYKNVNNIFLFNFLISSFNLKKYVDKGVFTIFCKYPYKLSTTLLSVMPISINSFVETCAACTVSTRPLQVYFEYSLKLPQFFKFYLFRGFNKKNRHYYYYHYKRPHAVIPYFIEKKLIKLEKSHAALFSKKIDLLKLGELILCNNPILREALYLKNNLIKQSSINRYSFKKKINFYRFDKSIVSFHNIDANLSFNQKYNKNSIIDFKDEKFFSVNNLNFFFFEKYRQIKNARVRRTSVERLFLFKRLNYLYNGSFSVKTKKYMYLKYAKLKKLNDRNCCNYKLRFFKNFIKTSRVKLKLM